METINISNQLKARSNMYRFPPAQEEVEFEFSLSNGELVWVVARATVLPGDYFQGETLHDFEMTVHSLDMFRSLSEEDLLQDWEEIESIAESKLWHIHELLKEDR